jgi:virulence-associated protein VapD
MTCHATRVGFVYIQGSVYIHGVAGPLKSDNFDAMRPTRAPS